MTREEALNKWVMPALQNTWNEKKVKEILKALEQETCEDVISRQAVLVSIKNLYPDMPVVDIMNARQKWLEKYAPYFECENAIESLPSVTPKQKTGHWIDDEFGSKCSCCGIHTHLDKFGRPMKFLFCSMCGADMGGRE